MNSENIHTACCADKIDVAIELNIIDRLYRTFDALDCYTIKEAPMCDLNYIIMDVMDSIDCLAELCSDRTQSIIGDRELVILHQLKKALHQVRHHYYYSEEYSKRHAHWRGCDSECNSCTCYLRSIVSSIRCIQCESRVCLQNCLSLIHTANTILTDAVKRYKETVES